jgi:hypothetical protein
MIMCKYASFVLTKDRCFWLPTSESHQEIINHYKLCEADSTGMRINTVAVEISPLQIFADLSKWIYKVDQDLLPEWYDATDCETRTRKELKKKVDKKLLSIFSDLDKFLASIPKTKFFKPDGHPIKSWKIFYGKTWAAARAAAWAAARDAAWDAAWAAARDAARAAAWAAARDDAWDGAWAAARNAARAAAWDAARAAAWAAARDDAWDAAGDAAGAAARAAAWAAARDAAWDAAWDASLVARIIICKGLKLDAKHIRYAKARWNVWLKGYGLYCDINGVLYVYAKEQSC